MLRAFFTILILLASTYLIPGCDNREHATSNKIIVFTASSAYEPVSGLIESFTKMNCTDVTQSIASSGTLARQIVNGADADLFISANKHWIDFLVEKDMLIKESVCKLVSNRLVLIKPIDSEQVYVNLFENQQFDFSMIKNVAIGDPSYVPVGHYAKQTLDSLGWTEQLEGKLVLAKDAVSVLKYVEMKACDLGIVYSSEIHDNSKVDIVAEVPASYHDPIVFYIGIIKGADSKTGILKDMLMSQQGKDVFTNYGFITD